jgi:Skp family chaperone for outer membrane proteins
MTWDELLKLFTGLSGIAVILVSLYTATTAASKSGFEQLERAFKRLEERNAEMEKRLAHLEQENQDLRDWAEALVAQLEDADIEPVSFKRVKRSIRTIE